MACLESSVQSLQHQARLLHYASTAFEVMCRNPVGIYPTDIHDREHVLAILMQKFIVQACRVGGGKKTRSEGAGLRMEQRVPDSCTLTRECAVTKSCSVTHLACLRSHAEGRR